MDQSDRAMSEMQPPMADDDTLRGQVRQALRRYMEESRIGTPTLQVRVIEADKPRHREIPLSTLQRFLTGSHRTSDHHVSLCHDFVKELPYYGEGKDIALFGAAASSFFHQPLDKDSRAALMAALERDVLGAYDAFRPPREGGPLRLGDSHISNISFTLAGDSPWLEVREDVFGLSRTETRQKFEGAALYAAPHLHIFLRDLFTRRPRLYTLERKTVAAEQGEYEGFEGRGHDATPRQNIRSSNLTDYFEVKFIPKPEQDVAR
jgi:hypothetical protein